LIAGGRFVRDHEMQAGTFFGGGALLLTAALAGVWAWMRGSRHGRVSGHGNPALARLGVRNAARYPVRSLLTAGLLASSAFLLIAVESFRRSPDRDFLRKDSGSGGFPLLAESDVPVYQDLNSGKGRDELTETLERQYRSRPDLTPEQAATKLREAGDLLQRTTMVPFRL